MPGPRRKARIIVLQALYEADLTGHPLEPVIDRLLREEELAEEASVFARGVARGITENRDRIDSIISRFATAFPLNQISAVDRNILRIAVYESLIDNKTPAKTAVNEAVEIAKAYGSESSPRFVNGVLGSALQER